MSERAIARALAAREGGECEVQTPAGFIDVLTPRIVYEVKEVHAWKAALGQVLAYARYYPERKPKLYLYGAASGKQKALITEHCSAVGIGVVWHKESRSGSDGAHEPPAEARLVRDGMTLIITARDVTYDIHSTITARLPVPQAALPRERLEVYADEAMELFGDLLDNELAMTLRYRFQDELLNIQRAREGIRGSPVCYRLNLSVQTNRGKPFRVSLPGVKTTFPSGAQGYGSNVIAPEVSRLYDCILHPEFRWTDSDGIPGTSIFSARWLSLGLRKVRDGWKLGG